MARTFSEIQLFVRGSIDLEPDELPDSILNLFIAEGVRKVRDAIEGSDYYQKTYTLSSVASTQSYLFSDIGSDLEQVLSVQGPHWMLDYVDHSYAKSVWPPDLLTEQEPYAYSFNAGKLFLWPTPGAVYDFSIEGRRTMVDPFSEGVGAFPDVPAEAHDLVAMWALSQTYAQQDDPETGQFFAATFGSGLLEVSRRVKKTPIPQPLIVNRMKGNQLSPPRLRYPFPIQGA